MARTILLKPINVKSILLIVVALVIAWWQYTQFTYADQLTTRGISSSSSAPSATASHDFFFTYMSASFTGSIVFEYCDNPLFAQPCDPLPGLDASGATLVNQTGNTGFTIDALNTTTSKIVLTRAPSLAATVFSTYEFDNITNPSVAQNVFVRISTYSSIDGTGAYTDWGGVVYAVLNPLDVGAYVPPFLRLCVGISVAPDCSTISGNSIDLGTLRHTQASSGQSQLSTATNSPTGYTVYALGSTMTSGNNFISALGSPTPSFPGNNQFGINLRNNSNPNIGTDPFGTGTGTPTASYNTPNMFMFDSGDAIAISNQPTEYNRMTQSYLVNIKSNQPPGVYSTTLTYVALAQF